ncbi:MAG: hypothetical protein HQK53_12375, partial [Oligoflexia bacterium]|nr:hypothetical protein [Oligoflexia bacterium]
MNNHQKLPSTQINVMTITMIVTMIVTMIILSTIPARVQAIDIGLIYKNCASTSASTVAVGQPSSSLPSSLLPPLPDLGSAPDQYFTEIFELTARKIIDECAKNHTPR